MNHGSGKTDFSLFYDREVRNSKDGSVLVSHISNRVGPSRTIGKDAREILGLNVRKNSFHPHLKEDIYCRRRGWTRWILSLHPSGFVLFEYKNFTPFYPFRETG